MTGKLISVGSSEGTNSFAQILEDGQLKEITLSEDEAGMAFPQLAEKHGWERPTETDMKLYRELRGPGPKVTYGGGTREAIDEFLMNIRQERE